jgi:hypothetical protein
MLWVHRCAVRVRSACQSAAKETNRTPGRVGPRHGLIPRGLRRLARSRDLDTVGAGRAAPVFSGTPHVSQRGRQRWRPRQRPGLPRGVSAPGRDAFVQPRPRTPKLRCRPILAAVESHGRRELCHVMMSASCQSAHRPAARRNPSEVTHNGRTPATSSGRSGSLRDHAGQESEERKGVCRPSRIAMDTEAWVAWSGR